MDSLIHHSIGSATLQVLTEAESKKHTYMSRGYDIVVL